MRSRTVPFLMLLLLSLPSACSSPGPGPGSVDLGDPQDMSGGGNTLRCSEDPLPLQNPRAHTLGETFFLPRPQAGPDCPQDPRWEVASAPPGSQSRAFHGGDWPRFTPDAPGAYTLRLAGVPGSEINLTAVRRSSAERFRNHYLTPLYGLQRVGDELWAANGAAYTVTVLSKQGDSYNKKDEIPVGSWPAALAWQPDLPYVLVANRGSDTIGFIDRARRVQEDALWIGDEPTGLALSRDGKRLYVTLPTMRQVAVVDVEQRSVVKRVEVGFDPRALLLSPDGARLYVASYRSANLQDGPGKMRKAEDDQDLWILNTSTLTVEKTVLTLSADLRALGLSPDGKELYIAATDGDTVSSQSDPMAKPFVHELIALTVDPASPDLGKVARRADLTRQPSAMGAPFVNPAGVAAAGATVWVSAESSNELLALDAATLAERSRTPVGQGARAIVVLDDQGTVAVHGYRSYDVTIVGADGKVRQRVALTEDPRPRPVAVGDEVFSRPGGAYAKNHACASCHVETQNDGMVWNFGPRVYHNVRPLQLLDATTPIEWGAYVSNTANFGWQGPSSIIARPPTQEEAEGLAAFLGSLIGAPRATGWTRPDGSYSEAGLRGKALFERLSCAGCHQPGLYTSRAYVPSGKSGEPADIPTLLGVYRHGVYMVAGQARSLEAALDVALAFTKAQLASGERADLLAFLRELTPKGAAPLAIWPDIDSNQAVGPEVTPYARFSEPVDDSQPGRSAAQVAADFVTLENGDGQAVPGTVSVRGAEVRFQPAQPLGAGQRYRFRVKRGLPFQRGGALEFDRQSDFTVAKPAAGALDSALRMTIYLPPMGPMGMVTPLPFDLDLLPAQDGALRLRMQLGPGQTRTLWAQLSGDQFFLEGFPLPLPPRGVADGGKVVGAVKETMDGMAGKRITKIEGTLRLGAPGINVPNIPFDIKPR